MTKILFTKKEIELLKCKPNVQEVSEKTITYTDEFKRFFISESEKEKLPRNIFEEVDYDVESISLERIKSAGKRWRAAYREKGIAGLNYTRKTNSSRPLERELSLEEKHARLEAQNQLLQAENELLKKLELIERRTMKKK